MTFTIRPGAPTDVGAIAALLPRLADYELPPRRRAEMFFGSDIALIERWAAGNAPDSFVYVAELVDGDADASQPTLAGVALVTMNRDHFSGEPNAHLEALAVTQSADGHGIGRALLDTVERDAHQRGAHTMSLHVVGNNARARHVYAKVGYREEMIRAIKFLD